MVILPVVKYGNEATKQSIRLLVSCESGEFFGDPEFGIRLKRYFFEQNNTILKDILIDELYTKNSCILSSNLY